MAIYDLTQTTPTKLKTGDIINVPYSGTYKTITLPKGKYKLEVWGAQGGSFDTTYVGGKGGYSCGTLTLADKETVFYCYAGGKGTDGTTSGTFAGGWNGGGQAYTSSATYDMSAGGGGSDIRIGSTSLYARVIVAGGGGGAGSYSGSYRYSGGVGGGTSGVAGSQYSTSYKAGLAGSQTAAGTSYYGTTANSTSYGTVAGFGVGGAGSSGYVAGGGGGWYGGGYARRASGGGGSGYVYTSSTASNYPSGCLLTEMYYLTDTSTVTGATSFIDPESGNSTTGRSGNGYVRVTVIEIKESKLRVKTKMDYTELSYIESTGTQYIDTGFMHNNNTRVVMDVEPTSITANAWLFEGRSSASTGVGNHGIFYYYGSTKKWTSDYNSSRINTGVDTIGRLAIDYNKNVCTINGTAVTHTASTFQSTATLYLLASHNGTSVAGYTNSKLYSCKVYDNDILIRDYVPAMDANNVVCLYDKVNQEFIYNAGSGTFIAGEVVAEAGSEQWQDAQKCYVKTADNTWTEGKSVYVKTIEDLTILDYIESTGTQYIDTGFKHNQNTRVVMDAKVVTQPSSHAWLFEGRASGVAHKGLFLLSGKTWTADYANGTSGQRTSISSVGITDRLNIDYDKNTIKVNDFTHTWSELTFQSEYNLALFAANTGGTVSGFIAARIYSCRIYDNSTLIRDYIPVLDSNGVACLYDKVTNQCFYNQGTGTFTTGYKTEFEPETELAFLESDGASYIDTGFKPKHNTRVVVDVSDVVGTDKMLFGAKNADSATASVQFALYRKSTTIIRSDYFGTNAEVTISDTMLRTIIDKNANNVSLYGKTIVNTNVASGEVPYSLYLFALNTSGAVTAPVSMKLYSCKIYDNGTLIRNYIPKTDTNGVPTLFDKVSGTYYYNQGTGTFNAGTILKRPYWKQVA